jgi:hypothetical protein
VVRAQAAGGAGGCSWVLQQPQHTQTPLFSSVTTPWTLPTVALLLHAARIARCPRGEKLGLLLFPAQLAVNVAPVGCVWCAGVCSFLRLTPEIVLLFAAGCSRHGLDSCDAHVCMYVCMWVCCACVCVCVGVWVCASFVPFLCHLCSALHILQQIASSPTRCTVPHDEHTAAAIAVWKFAQCPPWVLLLGLTLHMFWGRGREEGNKLTLVRQYAVCLCVCDCPHPAGISSVCYARVFAWQFAPASHVVTTCSSAACAWRVS